MTIEIALVFFAFGIICLVADYLNGMGRD